MGKLFEVVRCPVCNRVYPTGFWPKIAAVTKDCLGYLKVALGSPGGFPIVKELTLRREVRPGTLAIVKSRILGAVKLWLQKGWMPADDVLAVLNDIESQKVSGWRVIFTYDGFHSVSPVNSTYEQVSVARPLRMPLNKIYEEVKV